MQIFEYPYVIITIFVFCFIIAGLVGLYFALKCAKTANETEDKGFFGVKRIEKEYKKFSNLRKNKCLVYIGVSLDSMKILYSESKAMRIVSSIKAVLIKVFASDVNSYIAEYGTKSFIGVNCWDEEKIKENIEKCISDINKILIENEAVNIVGINFGYYLTDTTQVTFNEAISRAKQAFTISAGKDSLYHQWTNTSGKELEKKMKIENNIQNEIDNNRFFLEYQPVVDAKTKKVVGAEVLSRLNSQTDGVLSPGSFLSAVNSVGINDKFDYYIFEKNCKWISNNKSQRQKYVYAINFSRSTLCDKSFAINIINIIEKYGLNYNVLAIEMLEDKNLSKEEKDIITLNITKLKEKGILILLDDFGSGYTSFTDLSKFSVDTVKIDKEVTQGAVNEKGFVILKNIIQTAKDLGFKTLCEGVETKEHERIAIEAGSDMLQGYYYYRPLSVLQLEKIFENEKQM